MIVLMTNSVLYETFDDQRSFFIFNIFSVLRASKFSVLNLIEIIILWVYYTIPFGLSLFRHFWTSLDNFWNYFVWLRITKEGSVPEMRIWSILLIKSELKWCIHLSRSLFLYLWINRFCPKRIFTLYATNNRVHLSQSTRGEQCHALPAPCGEEKNATNTLTKYDNFHVQIIL